MSVIKLLIQILFNAEIHEGKFMSFSRVYCLLLQARRHDHMSAVLAAMGVTATGCSSDVPLVPHDQ
jgi:hypothetical protein